GELSENAKYHRLRRLCKRTRNGKLLVPEAVEKAYIAGGASRDKLMEQLEECSFKKAEFIALCTRTYTRIREKENKSGWGWFTTKQMKDELKWG
ncbi:unnamed protein product, partial [Symbiodinium necroappetens]